MLILLTHRCSPRGRAAWCCRRSLEKAYIVGDMRRHLWYWNDKFHMATLWSPSWRSSKAHVLLHAKAWTKSMVTGSATKSPWKAKPLKYQYSTFRQTVLLVFHNSLLKAYINRVDQSTAHHTNSLLATHTLFIKQNVHDITLKSGLLKLRRIIFDNFAGVEQWLAADHYACCKRRWQSRRSKT